MTHRDPPSLALTLLEHSVPDDDPLVGDLIEEFSLGRSRRWFWWQVFAAIAASRKRVDDIRPLKLVDVQPADALERSRRAGLRVRPVNLTASPLREAGGLGVVALAFLLTIEEPAAWWALLAAMLAGALLGILMIARRSMSRRADAR